jgi:hypothetical protein
MIEINNANSLFTITAASRSTSFRNVRRQSFGGSGTHGWSRRTAAPRRSGGLERGAAMPLGEEQVPEDVSTTRSPLTASAGSSPKG